MSLDHLYVKLAESKFEIERLTTEIELNKQVMMATPTDQLRAITTQDFHLKQLHLISVE